MSKLIVVDEQNIITRFEEAEKCHDGDGILHRAFSVFIFNDKNELLIQQRSEFKRLWPLFWSNSCCGHPRQNEELVKAAEKRLQQECGTSCSLQELYKFQYSAKYEDKGSENEMCSVLVGKLHQGETILPDPDEIADYKWITLSELEKDMNKNPENYTPWFKMEVAELLSHYLDKIK